MNLVDQVDQIFNVSSMANILLKNKHKLITSMR